VAAARLLSMDPNRKDSSSAMKESPALRCSSHRSCAGMAYGLAERTFVAEVHITLPEVPEWPDVEARLSQWLGEPVQAAPEGAGPAVRRLLGLLLHAQGELQRQQRVPVFGGGRIVRIRQRTMPSQWSAVLAMPCYEPAASLAAIEWVIDALNLLCRSRGAEGAEAALHQGLERCRQSLRAIVPPGINNYHFLREAYAMGIPTRRLLPKVWRYGLGQYGRLLNSTLTQGTPAIAVTIARSKTGTARMLRAHGVPVPRHQVVTSADQACAVASALGYPVVVKPDDLEQGRGVAAGLVDADGVRAAFDQARALSRRVLVEKHHPGGDYRLTVFRGEVVKILHRRPGGVIADGLHDVQTLLHKEQQLDYLQRALLQQGKMRLELDDEALGLLRQQELTPASIPEKGRFIALRRKANISAGGVQTLVKPAQCHPDNLALALRAAQALRLDLCGIDMIVPDMSRSWLDTGGVIIEVNAQPQIGVSQGPEAYGHVLRGLMEGRWQIPLFVAVFEPDQVPSTLAGMQGLVEGCECNGLASTHGLWVDGTQVARELSNGFHAADALLGDTRVRAAGLALTVDELLQLGLPAARLRRVRFFAPAGLAGARRRLWREALGVAALHADEPSAIRCSEPARASVR